MDFLEFYVLYVNNSSCKAFLI